MRFADVIGQNAIKARLIHSVKQGRIPHAQMFIGSEGTGNLALALAYASYIHCSNKGVDDSCGECRSCLKHKSMMHPDMHFSFPFPSVKADLASELYAEWRKACSENPYMNYEMWIRELGAENKQGNIPIKECHAIIKSLSLKPFESEYKILLMWLPEYLGVEGNVILKLLEEPPEGTLFLLVAENQEKIITTILSRVQMVRVPPIEHEELSSALQKTLNTSQDEASRLALLGAGNYLRAMELSGTEQNLYLEAFRNWMGYCYQKKLDQAVNWADAYASNGREQLKGFFLYSLEILRAVMLHQFTPDATGLSAEEQEFVKKFSSIINAHSKGELMYQWFNNAAYEVERNGNAKVILSDLSFKLARILK